MTKIEQLEKRRKMILRGFTLEQLDTPVILDSLQKALTNIDIELCQRSH